MSVSFGLVPNQKIKKITLTCGDWDFATFSPILSSAFVQVEADVQHELVATLYWLSLCVLLLLPFTRELFVSEEL